jgi:hypothetical protein
MIETQTCGWKSYEKHWNQKLLRGGGKLLMERYMTLYSTICGAHCIDLMLKDTGKISWIKDIIE